MGRVGVVIPVLSQFKMAVDAIATIRSKTCWVETYVMPNYRWGLPLSAAWNMGIEEVFENGNEYALVINDDILLARNTVDDLFRAACENPDVLVTGQNIAGITSNPDEIFDWPAKADRYPVIAGGPDFACFMISPEIYEKVGQFDENFVPAYFEDNDYHRRIDMAGLDAGTVLGASFYHYGSQTQNANPKKPVVPSNQFIANRNYYISKWGGEPGRERFRVPFNRS